MPEPTGQPGPAGTSAGRWEQRLNEAGSRVEDELRKVVRYLDEEVVPDIRRNGSIALRRASSELERLARYMDDQHADGQQADQHGDGQHRNDQHRDDQGSSGPAGKA